MTTMMKTDDDDDDDDVYRMHQSDYVARQRMFPGYVNEGLNGSYCGHESTHNQHSITTPLPLFYHPFHSQQHQLLQR